MQPHTAPAQEPGTSPDLTAMQGLLPIRYVAEWLGIHVNTAKRWAARGDFPTYRFGTRGDIRVDPADVRAYLAARRGQEAGS